ncbi:NFX1-type zinc finger-containing protein 1-like [Bolinopsis microptera]|uniref:NFX1-type zinc finger-containing protein 1-like n=1 Tax=Bolinopsis microptera TaxID=2820187 RepID=UPI0030798D0A
MSIFKNVSVAHLELEHAKILIFLKFSLDQRVANWKKSKKLMSGNLLCVTVEGDFSDPIWLTVADRDEVLLEKHSVIGVELISFHSSDADTADNVKKLLFNSGKMIMAESPTYFQSFKHVLNSLQYSEIGNFPLADEIIHGSFKQYEGCRNLISPYLKDVEYEKLEENQRNAFVHALASTLGIIQGPPGTGKTLVGAKLAKILLCLQKDNKLNNLLNQGQTPLNYADENHEGNSASKNEDNPRAYSYLRTKIMHLMSSYCTA